jgi:hypothetical protein
MIHNITRKIDIIRFFFKGYNLIIQQRWFYFCINNLRFSLIIPSAGVTMHETAFIFSPLWYGKLNRAILHQPIPKMKMTLTE